MKNDYSGDNVRHSPRKVKRSTVAILALCLVAGSIDLAEAGDLASCTDWAEIAKTTMEIRQINPDMARDFNAYAGQDKAIVEVMHSLTAAAYERPRFSSVEYRQREAQNFADSLFAACMGRK